MSVESDHIADLIKSCNDLKSYFEQARDSIEQRIADQNKRIDSFLQMPLVVQGTDKKMYRIAMGQSSANDWQKYTGAANIIFVKIDTSTAGFKESPYYYSSLYGDGYHLRAKGATSISSGKSNSFEVYLEYDGITVDFAKQYNWHIRWLAVGI